MNFAFINHFLCVVYSFKSSSFSSIFFLLKLIFSIAINEDFILYTTSLFNSIFESDFNCGSEAQ